MLLGIVELACTHAFTEMNEHIDLQILTHKFVAIPDFRQTQIITFKE